MNNGANKKEWVDGFCYGVAVTMLFYLIAYVVINS